MQSFFRFTIAAGLAASAAAVVMAQEPRVPTTADLQRMTARFAPTDITADVSKLSANDRRALGKLIQASQLIDALFLRQVWSGNEAMLLSLGEDDTP